MDMKRRDVILGGLGFLAAAAVKPFAAVQRQSQSGWIETFAAQMSNNTWQQIALDDANFKSLSVYTGGTNANRSLLEYSHQFFWNANAKELHFRGGGASSGNSNLQRHLRYSESTGKWDPVTPWKDYWTHQWGHFTGDPRTGDLYYRKLTSNQIYKWTYAPYPATPAWQLFDYAEFPGSKNAQALEYHPDLNGGKGGLIFFSTRVNNGNVWITDDTLKNWTQVDSSIWNEKVTVEGMAIYVPGQKWVLIGGGKGDYPSRTRVLAKIDENGIVTALNKTPFDFGANADGFICGHPNGRIFGVDIGGRKLYQYSEASDSWSSSGLASLPFDGHWCAGTMIPEYNVIYVAAQLGGAASSTVQHWLYKFDPGPAAVKSAGPANSRGIITASIAPMPAAAGTRTTVDVRLNRPGTVDISLMKVNGQKLRTLFSGSMKAGTSRTHLSLTGKTGRPLAAGTYLIGFGVNGTRKLTKRISVF
jgi:hypothetical protein